MAATTLTEFSDPIGDCTCVFTLLRGLNNKFRPMVSILKMCQPFPTFDASPAPSALIAAPTSPHTPLQVVAIWVAPTPGRAARADNLPNAPAATMAKVASSSSMAPTPKVLVH